MGITIPPARLRSTLEAAVMLAESEASLSEEWVGRVQRIGACPSRSYIAALGTALLAKAADQRVDVLTVKARAGPNAYSMRGVVKVLVERATHYGYHLGVTRSEPLNNQPWFRIKRVDEGVEIKANARPYHRDLIRYLNDLNAMSSGEALEALAVFLRERIQFAARQRETRARLRAAESRSLERMIQLAEHFVRDDPEGGRRGQALVAAVLDLTMDEVVLGAINDPSPFDVRVLHGGVLSIGVEVKQKPVSEEEAFELAEESASEGVDRALVVAIAEGQRPLDRERIRRESHRDHGVLLVVYETVAELLSQSALYSGLTASQFASELPASFLQRMEEHGVSPEGRQHWVDLCGAPDA
ncbi:MAG: restriction endonuclease, SacI family [Microthrixaceae bacterium]|nr:restriction endonuclease, SacI family [Microthrixaceae bacterium]